jgi:succinate dehydrogenase/fumarate reductase flavoprotein subunit
MSENFWEPTMTRIGSVDYPTYTLDAAVIGSGCAGFNAADCLYDLGVRRMAIFTEGRMMGTSRNTGSDKQTYYKLSLTGDPDSVQEMAENLFDGEGVHGDNALAEAAGSVRAFMKLCQLGVGFPTNEYGEYAGYKTDHDPRQRATSAGPLTSKFMTECLEKAVDAKGIHMMDGFVVTELLVRDGTIYGFLCWDPSRIDEPCRGVSIVYAPFVILATGGPAGSYEASVYPPSQCGMSGMALRAGAKGANLSEWQYGLASIDFRWNVSGTYQQVLPRYISVDADGVEREFLPDYFDTPEEALNQVFLKGYQWPFDVNKIKGSSIIDIIVHHETMALGRKVYMDFRTNPRGLENGLDGLSREAADYLRNSGATQDTPIARLAHMNPLAIDLYKNHSIDLYTQPLRVAICAQHHNGGIGVDANWETNIHGLYVAGEAAGNFGVHRPGGSALNATQVGSFRAAQDIAVHHSETKDPAVAAALAAEAAPALTERIAHSEAAENEKSNLVEIRDKAQHQMTFCAAHIRDAAQMKAYYEELKETIRTFDSVARWKRPVQVALLLRTRDILETQLALLSAMLKAGETFGSRGSAMIHMDGGIPASDRLLQYIYEPKKTDAPNQVLITRKEGDDYLSYTEDVRPIPQPDNWFENVWARYRQQQAKLPQQ